MSHNKKVLAIIPARSGSKGISNKNIRILAGKPLIGWAIERGKESGVFDRIVLMTDSEEYSEIGRQYGAEVPFLEKKELADDTSHVFHAVKWYLEQFIKTGYKPDYVALLEPTAPARQASHIQDLVNLVVNSNADAGFTVTEVPSDMNAYWQIKLDDSQKATLAVGGEVKEIVRQRQQLSPLYVRGGATYVARTEFLLKDEPDMYGEDVRALVIPSECAVDLDSEDDWEKAEEIVLRLKR